MDSAAPNSAALVCCRDIIAMLKRMRIGGVPSSRRAQSNFRRGSPLICSSYAVTGSPACDVVSALRSSSERSPPRRRSMGALGNCPSSFCGCLNRSRPLSVHSTAPHNTLRFRPDRDPRSLTLTGQKSWDPHDDPAKMNPGNLFPLYI